jgi:hypothetical protein
MCFIVCCAFEVHECFRGRVAYRLALASGACALSTLSQMLYHLVCMVWLCAVYRCVRHF